MKDIRLSTEFWDHPKTVKLIRRIGLEGIRSLQILWLWTRVNRPEGILTGMNAEDIEIAARWEGEPERFVNESLNVRWIDVNDETYSLHDWGEHNPWSADSVERGDKARFSRMAKTHKKLYEKFKKAGISSITSKQYAALRMGNDSLRIVNGSLTIVNEKLTPSPSPSPTHNVIKKDNADFEKSNLISRKKPGINKSDMVSNIRKHRIKKLKGQEEEKGINEREKSDERLSGKLDGGCAQWLAEGLRSSQERKGCGSPLDDSGRTGMGSDKGFEGEGHQLGGKLENLQPGKGGEMATDRTDGDIDQSVSAQGTLRQDNVGNERFDGERRRRQGDGGNIKGDRKTGGDPEKPAPKYRTKKNRWLTGQKLTDFEEFWKAFHDGAKKLGKAPAADSWLDIKDYSPELVKWIISSARKYAEERQDILQRNGTPKWAQGWLTDRRWEDYPPEEKSSQKPAKTKQQIRAEIYAQYGRKNGTDLQTTTTHANGQDSEPNSEPTASLHDGSPLEILFGKQG